MVDWETFGQDATIVLTLILLEAVLSFDNAAILAAMVRKLPVKDRKKALLYGLVGAYALRTAAILLAAWLIRTPILKVIGGAYLLYLGFRHFYLLAKHREEQHREHKVGGGLLARLGLPALVVIIVQIELVDLAFAVDQVVVAVAFTERITLIIIAAMLGILFLRLAAAMISRVMDWLPILEHMAYVAVSYVGLKLVLLHPLFVRGASVDAEGHVTGGTCAVPFIPVQHEVAVGAQPGCEIPTAISIAITLCLFLLPVLFKLVFGIPRPRDVSKHVASTTEPPPPGPSVQHLTAAHVDVKTAPRQTPEDREPRRPG